MPQFPISRRAVALALVAALSTAGSAQADLTAEAVWEAWQAYAAASGQTIEAGATEREGEVLTVSDLRLTSGVDATRAVVAIDRIAFTELGDGTVGVAMDDSYVAEVTGPDGAATVTVSHPGLRLVVSEADGGLLHRLNAPEFTLALTGESTGGAGPVPELTIGAVGVAGSYQIPTDPAGPAEMDLTIAALNADLEGSEGADSVLVDYAATGARLRASGQRLDLLPGEDDDLAVALRGGLGLSLETGYDTLRFRFDVTEDGQRSEVAGTAVDGQARFVMDADEFAFETASRNGEITIVGPDMPLPSVTLAAGLVSYGLRLPVSASETAQDMSVLVRVVDLSLPEAVWDMLDPEAQLARGPATAVLDLAGQVVLPNDLFSDDTAFAAMVEGPAAAVQVEQVTLSELLLRFGGAALTGVGALTFDNTDLVTFPGVPRPEGTLDFTLRGGNALIDALVAMGALPEDQAMGARMMLALFMRPGDGPDELMSTIEFREGGGVFANGMRLQ